MLYGCVQQLVCRGNIRSEARYIWSNEPALTIGTGVLDTLSLIAEFGAAMTFFLFRCYGVVP